MAAKSQGIALDQIIFERGEQAGLLPVRLRNVRKENEQNQNARRLGALFVSIQNTKIRFSSAKVCKFVHSVVRPPGLSTPETPKNNKISARVLASSAE
jgi:hypothetical protein